MAVTLQSLSFRVKKAEEAIAALTVRLDAMEASAILLSGILSANIAAARAELEALRDQSVLVQ